jgi:hypothetical protein
MPFLKKSNNAQSTINQVGGLTLLDTELIVTDASSFPATGDFLLTVWNSETHPDPTDDVGREIILVTAVAGNTFTIVRGQEDTVASLHANGTIVAMLITAGTFEEIEQAIPASSHDQNTDTILQTAGLILDQSQLLFDTDAKFYNTNTGVQIAQSFIPANSGNLSRIIVKVFRASGGANDLIVELRGTSAGLPTAGVLATETILASSLEQGEWVDLTIDFSSPFSVTTGTTYAVVFRQEGSEQYYFENEPFVNPYPNGSAQVKTGAGAWIPDVADDLYFQIFTFIDATDLINNGTLKSDLDADGGILVDGRDLSVDGAAQDSHIADQNNPHNVSKTNVGLSNVPDLDTTDAVNHVSDTNNPHGVEADQIATDDSGVTVQEALDALEAGGGQLESLMAQDIDGDLRPIDDYILQGGSFELDSNYALQPKTTIEEDLFFEYDINNDLIPKE